MLPFNGVQGPAELLHLNGDYVIWSAACRPHDCPDGHVYILFDPRSGAAWGAAHSDAKVYVFGNPSASQETLLLVLVARSLVGAYEPFPLSDSSAKRVRAALRDSDGSISALITRTR